MKKIIRSKGFSKKCPDLRKKHDEPKQVLLSNNWYVRNDSGNVAAALHPDCFLEKPKRHIGNVPCKPSKKNNKDNGVYKKCCLGSNTCYCKEEAIRPSLLRRPNKCLSLEDFNDKFRSKLTERSSIHCFCKERYASSNHVDLSDREILKKYQDELDNLNTNLQITNQREEYEKFRHHERDQYLKEIGQYRPTIKNKLILHGSDLFFPGSNNMFVKNTGYIDDATVGDEEYKQKTRQDMQTLSKEKLDHGRVLKEYIDDGTLNESSTNNRLLEKCNNRFNRRFSGNKKENLPDENTNNDEDDFLSSDIMDDDSEIFNKCTDIDQFRKFRNKNYFETHAVEDQIDENTLHTCVYKYELDDRFVTRGVNDDIYGRSRCFICNKSMNITPEKSYFCDGITPAKLKSISKCHGFGLAPNSIITTTSSSIKVAVNEDFFSNLARYIGKYQKPQYMNTLALRQQKMITNRTKENAK